jgi:cytochrome c oxidase assembly protein subunit 15
MPAYRKIAAAAVAAQIMIVVTGAAVRLTGSGLGCTDWPGCSADRFVPAWGFHHWVEFGNRLLIFVLVVSGVVATVAARRLRPARRDLVWLSAALIAGVFAQAIIGAVVVVLDLDPRLTLAHFLVSMVLITDAAVLLHRSRPPAPPADLAPAERFGPHGRPPDGDGSRGPAAEQGRRRLWLVARATVVAGGVVLATGTVVTGSGPHGGDDRAARFDLALRSVARVHSGAMWLFLAGLVATVVGARRVPVGPAARRPLYGLVAVTVGQAAIGYLQYALGVPAGLVAVHVLGASVMWALAVTCWLRMHDELVGATVGGPFEAAPVPVLSRG